MFSADRRFHLACSLRRAGRLLLLTLAAALLAGCAETIPWDDPQIFDGVYEGTLTEILAPDWSEGATVPVRVDATATRISDDTYEVRGTITIGDAAPVELVGEGHSGGHRFGHQCFCAPLPPTLELTVTDWLDTPLVFWGGYAYGERSDEGFSMWANGHAGASDAPSTGEVEEYRLELAAVGGE